MEQPPTYTYTMEKCASGGWKARFDPEQYREIADVIRSNEDLDVDTDHMLLWHRDNVKISFVKSSGVMMIRTDEKDRATDLLKSALRSDPI